MRFEEKDWKTIEHTVLVSTTGSGTGKKLLMNLIKTLFYKLLESQPPLPVVVTVQVPPVKVEPETPVVDEIAVVDVPVPVPVPADDSDPFAVVSQPASLTVKKSKK
jgi:hypothetical protein